MAEESKTDKVKDLLLALNTTTMEELDSEDIPKKLSDVIAVGDGVETEQMRKQLAPAVQIRIKADGTSEEVDGVPAPASLNDFVVTGKNAKTVNTIIKAAQEPANCMALILDKYITLKIEKAITDALATGRVAAGEGEGDGT